jgi:CubicO group peptidase (beta-lactamase class C family)
MAFLVDLWGGWVDIEHGTPWVKDTITATWSVTKTMTALAALVLVDRGELDVYAPVARYWPEFAASGKAGIEVRHLLSHASGVSGWARPFNYDEVYDWDRSTSLLAAQAPWWSRAAPRATTQLALAIWSGEVVRRITGTSIGRFFADEIAGPLGGGLPHRSAGKGFPPGLQRRLSGLSVSGGSARRTARSRQRAGQDRRPAVRQSGGGGNRCLASRRDPCR